MNFWDKYKKILNRNFRIKGKDHNSLDYWKNKLFCQTVIYILPFSLIALIPGIIYSWANGLWYLIVIDFISVFIIICIGFIPRLNIRVRQVLFIFCVYLISTTFLYLIGITGPGLVYLLGATFFFIIIFPNEYAYYPSIINLLICGLIAGLLPFDILPWADSEYHNQAQWLASSSNLIFLGFLSSALIPMVFKGLENALQKEQNLRNELNQKHKVLETTLVELKNKNSDLEVFAYSASHDLQEPLRMITSFLGQLEKNYNEKLDDRGKKYIYFAVDGAKRMRQIIQDLLEYSRIGKKEEEKEMVVLHELVNEICELHKRSIDEKSAKISTKNLPSINCFKTPLFQVFQNLIGNALKYSSTDAAPEIWIAAEETPTRWIFSVKDNGIGINPEYHDKIFVLFQRLHGKGEYEGTGMGLAIVKKIVENLGGEIWLKSQEGEGSTFFFTVHKQFEEGYVLN